MSIAERARELAADIEFDCCDGDYVFVGSVAAKLIEQALLAERRSVWGEAAKICDQEATAWRGEDGSTVPVPAEWHSYAFHIGEVAIKLRAAAEKEVGAK